MLAIFAYWSIGVVAIWNLEPGAHSELEGLVGQAILGALIPRLLPL